MRCPAASSLKPPPPGRSAMTERRLLLRALPAALGLLFVLALLPQPAAANPAVPYCAVGSYNPAGGGAPRPIMPELCKQATGRVFPEASALSLPSEGVSQPNQAPATDFVSYYEFKAGLDYLAAQYPDSLTVNEVAQSRGLCSTPQPPQTTC